jgi:hypothetical protein
MEANELRIGNWVNFEYKGLNYGKLFIDKNYFSHYENKEYIYTPIPITEEWLLKFGFKYYQNVNGYTYRIDFRIHFVKFENGFTTYLDNTEWSEIQYVHELQNLYFALTQKELTL